MSCETLKEESKVSLMRESNYGTTEAGGQNFHFNIYQSSAGPLCCTVLGPANLKVSLMAPALTSSQTSISPKRNPVTEWKEVRCFYP